MSQNESAGTVPVFTPIDLESWAMSQQFYYYTQMAPTGYSVTVKLDVTETRKYLKSRKIKFFPAYLYLVTRQIGRQDELRVGLKDGTLGHWQNLTPAYPQLSAIDHTTSLLWTLYEPNFASFYKRYLSDVSQYGECHGILTRKGVPPENSYIISCIPWFTFESFSLYNHGIKDYYVPSFEAGKFIEEKNRILMPLSITVHHATTDGYHLKVFFEGLQEDFNQPENWCSEITEF